MDSYDSEDSDPDEEDATPVADQARPGWIGVIHIPVLEYYNVRRGSSKSWSVLEKVCAQLLCFIGGMHDLPTNSLRKQPTFGDHQMTSEKRVQKFHTDDRSLPRPG